MLITAWESIPLAVEGMRYGAFDFITKPWNNRTLLQRVSTALSLSETTPQTNSGTFDRSAIIGNNPALTEMLETAARVAPTDARCLSLVKTGPGRNSSRRPYTEFTAPR